MSFQNISRPILLTIIAGSTFGFNTNILAADLNTTSAIEAVKIFPGSAKVTRVATIEVAAGEHTLEITDLPMRLIQSSLRVTGTADADVKLGSISLKSKINTELVLEEERALRKQIDSVSQERSSLQDIIKRQQSKLEYITAMGSGGDSEAGSRYLQLPMEQWQEAWKTLEDATAAAQQLIRETSLEVVALDAELKKLNSQLRLVASNQRSTRIAGLSLEASADTTLKVEISYLINGASWAPVYDADLDTQSGKLTIKSQAEISQRTGENWNNTKVTLSTLRPSQSSQLATLEPWSIDFAPDLESFPVARGMAMSEEMTPMMEADMGVHAVASAPMAKRVEAEQSVLVSADFSADYIVPRQVSLDTGSEKKRFALSEEAHNSDIVLASTPRLDPRVLLSTSFKYNKDTPLLSGNLSLYRDGNYVGSTHLSQQQPGQEVKLSFGEDDKVKLTFQPDPDAKSEDGIFFGKRKVVKRAYQITMNNQHDKSYPIHLYDNVPVASHEDITVELSGDAPSEKNIEDKKGVMVWKRTLKPKTEQRLRYGYSVSYPEDKHVFGLQ